MSYSSWPAVSNTLSTISSPSTLTLKIMMVSSSPLLMKNISLTLNSEQ